MAYEDQTPDDLGKLNDPSFIQSSERSNLEAGGRTMNIDQADVALNKEEDIADDKEESEKDDSQEQGILVYQNLAELSGEELFSTLLVNELSLAQLTTQLQDVPRYYAIFDINIKELEKNNDNGDKQIRELIEQWRRREEEVAARVDDMVKRYIQALITRYSVFVRVLLLRKHQLREDSDVLKNELAQSSDLDEFKKDQEDNGNKETSSLAVSSTDTCELDDQSGDSLEETSVDGLRYSSSDMEEWDQETQELGTGSEEGYEASAELGGEEIQEVKNKKDFMRLTDSKMKAYICDQSTPTSVSNILEFGAKIYEFIHEKKADFKKEQHGAKKMISLMKWLKRSTVISDENLELIQAVKAEVVGLASKVSSLLATLMFLMLKNEAMKAKLAVLEFAIKWVTEDGDSTVTRTIDSLLEIIVHEVEEKLDKGKTTVADCVPAPIDVTIFTEFYQLILLFLDGIKFFEHILMTEAERPDSDSTDSMKNLLCSVNEYEKEYSQKVEAGIQDIYALKELYSGEAEDVTMNHAMELKIDELWNQVWKSEEDKGSDIVAELDN